jgi:hypothetical protein
MNRVHNEINNAKYNAQCVTINYDTDVASTFIMLIMLRRMRNVESRVSVIWEETKITKKHLQEAFELL